MNPAIELLSDKLSDHCFIDTETRALWGADPLKGNVKFSGAHEYARHSKVIILTYAIGDAPVQAWTLPGDLSGTLSWRDAPADLREHLARVHAGEAWFVAWNAAFDRQAMNRGMVAASRADTIPVTGIIDAMAQGACAGLPIDLAGAARQVGLSQKVDEGKALIGLFCTAGGATPDSDPEAWARFVHYAEQDIEALRDIFKVTRQLPRAEWEVYWANETVNDRGLPFDRALAEAASRVATVYDREATGEVRRITGQPWGPKHHVALAGWAFDRLQHIPEAVDIMAKSYEQIDCEDGPPRFEISKVSLDRARIEKLIPLLEARDERMGLTDDEFAVLELCEVKLYAAGSTVQKFAKALPMLGADDRLRGQYTFNGAAQTGRFSSRGLQQHNMTRAWVGMEQKDTTAELRIIEKLLDLPEEVTVEHLRELEQGFGPVGRSLSRLIRPAILAPEGQVVLWGDYSNIEARVLPWMSDDPRAEATLDIFREGDRDPTAPDVYMIEAAKTYHKPPEDVNKSERQIGKVQVLSLGFGGGWRALLAMAANYRLSLTQAEAEPLVKGWRANNPWAVDFWSAVERAAMRAFNDPGTAHQAGRLVYYFDPSHMGGTLFCLLPSERLLAYPGFRHREVEKQQPDGSVETVTAPTYFAGGNVRTFWSGLAVENSVQAAAADLLRASIARIEREWPGFLVGHTHDELIGLVPEKDVDSAQERLVGLMTRLPNWATGLPVAADAEHNEHYTKVEG